MNKFADDSLVNRALRVSPHVQLTPALKIDYDAVMSHSTAEPSSYTHTKQ